MITFDQLIAKVEYKYFLECVTEDKNMPQEIRDLLTEEALLSIPEEEFFKLAIAHEEPSNLNKIFTYFKEKFAPSEKNILSFIDLMYEYFKDEEFKSSFLESIEPRYILVPLNVDFKSPSYVSKKREFLKFILMDDKIKQGLTKAKDLPYIIRSFCLYSNYPEKISIILQDPILFLDLKENGSYAELCLGILNHSSNEAPFNAKLYRQVFLSC